jgi:hypothetical protein
MTVRFALDNGFTLHLNVFVQSPFPAVGDRFKLGPPDKASDPLIAKGSSAVDSDSCPAKAFFSCPNRENSEGAKSGESGW